MSTAIPAHQSVTLDPSATDMTTGLLNRVGLSIVGSDALSSCRKNDLSATLIVLRITNLADIDEAFGYSEGDRAALELTQFLTTCFSRCEVIGRPTVDTFAVLVTGSEINRLDCTRDCLQGHIAQRNGDPTYDYEIRLRTDTTDFDPSRHSGLEQMICEIEHRMDRPKIDDTLELVLA